MVSLKDETLFKFSLSPRSLVVLLCFKNSKEVELVKKVWILFLLVAFLFISVGTTMAEDELVLWHHEFVTEWAGREQVTELFRESTELNVAEDYGPSLYRDIAQRFIVQAQTGTPDVLEGVLEQMFTYARAGLLFPLDDFFAEYEDRDLYVENAIEALRYDGKLYGIPYNTNVRLILYRESIFEEYDLSVPTNWEELIHTAAYITNNVPDMQGFMFTTQSREVRAFQEFMSFYFQLNQNMFHVGEESVEVVATPEELAQVLDLYYSLFFKGGIDLNERGADWKTLDYGYTAGRYAMVTVGPWLWGHRYEEDARGDVLDDTGIAPLPVVEGGTPATYMEVKPIMINAFSQHPEKAWELLKDVTSKDFQLLINSLSGVLSPRMDVMEEDKMADNWWLSGFGDYMEHGVALDPVSWERPQHLIIEAIQKTIYKQETPEDAGEWLYQELVKVAEQL